MKRAVFILSFLAILLIASIGLSQRKQAAPERITAAKSDFTEGAGNVFLSFNGAWRPGISSLLIGGENFKTLENMRYIDGGIEGITGYSEINTTAVNEPFHKPRAGYHFFKDRPAESHVLLQSFDAAAYHSRIYQNQTPIPEQGNFEVDYLHEDLLYSTTIAPYNNSTQWHDGLIAAFSDTLTTEWADVDGEIILGAETSRARFSPAPGGQVVYCNGVESQIWAGNESRVALFIVSTSEVTNYITSGKEYSIEVNDEYDDADSCAGVSGTVSGGTAYWLVASTRPISGVSYYVKTANSQSGKTVYVKEWNGTSWGDLSATDGTYGLNRSGNVSFSSTVNTSRPRYLDGGMFYWYQFRCEGGASVYQTTLNIPWQNITDLWDGTPKVCINFQVSRQGIYKDYTLEVNEPSSDLYPITAEIGGLVAGDYILTMFSDRQTAIKFNMLTGNTNAITCGVTPYYWDGSTWTQPTSWYDGTTDKGITPFATSGVINWNAPSSGEFKTELYGVHGYAYKFEIGGVIGGVGALDSSAQIDTVWGVSAPLDMKTYKYPVFYKNRVFMCGYLKGYEANRVDYCRMNAPDVWNGPDSSDGGRGSLYIGDGKELTGSASLFNRYGSEIFSVLIFFKKNEAYVMHGEVPEDFAKKIFRISSTIGCPAPYTISTVEMGYEMLSDELLRNVVVWLSSNGPVMFDGSVMQPIMGIEVYFVRVHSFYVGADAIENAFAWYDEAYKEWNLRVGNYWLAYDLVRRKWFSRNTGIADLPQCAFEVTSTNGMTYVYAGVDSGKVMRLDYGGGWSGVSITNVVETGNFFADNNGWYQTLLRRIKFAFKGISNKETMQVTHYANDATSGTSLVSVSLYDATDGKNKRISKSINEIGWSHRLKFSNSSATNKGLQPLGWGFQFKVMREDEEE